jgi:acyl-coenzyme A synthetase/AMP-(fatty) acid ligase
MLPLNFNFAQDVIDKLAGERRTGLIFVDYHGHRRDYAFLEISDRSQRYAAVLRALGVVPGERVALCNANTSRCLFLLLALARLGAVGVLCGENFTFEQTLARIRDSGATTVITNRRRRPTLEALQAALPQQTTYVLLGEEREGWARMDTLSQAARPFRGITTQLLDMAFAFGNDVLDYGALYEARAEAIDLLSPRESDRVWTTLAFGSPEWLTFTQAPYWRGACAVMHEAGFNPAERLDLLRELEVTILCSPAAEYRALLLAPQLRDAALRRLRRCVAIGGDDALEREWENATGKALLRDQT